MNKKEYEEAWVDFKDFAFWILVGAMSGWVICILAYRGAVVYDKLDIYGMWGATLAVFWAIFRRLKHVEHLGHIRKHLSKGK